MVVVANIGAFDLILLSGLLVPRALALSSFDSGRMGSVLNPCNPSTRGARESVPARAY